MSMVPEIFHGAYYHVETWSGSYVVPCDLFDEGEPTPDNLAKYMPQGVGMSMGADENQDRAEWVITEKTGYYGRLTMPGYLDCTDWETADTEADLLESLRGDDDDCDDDGETETPSGWDSVD